MKNDTGEYYDICFIGSKSTYDKNKITDRFKILGIESRKGVLPAYDNRKYVLQYYFVNDDGESEVEDNLYDYYCVVLDIHDILFTRSALEQDMMYIDHVVKYIMSEIKEIELVPCIYEMSIGYLSRIYEITNVKRIVKEYFPIIYTRQGEMIVKTYYENQDIFSRM